MEAFERLAEVLPGFERRPEQLELAGAVEDALASGRHLLAQAGTGTGKTLGYLLPALESEQRVVVATATKALQEQLLTKDLPLAAAALGREVRVAVLKGRQNYVCRLRAQALAGTGLGLLGTPRDEAAYERLLPWLDATPTGDRAELDEEPPPGLWSELSVGSDGCLGRRCHFVASCFAEEARRRAMKAELVIANHALYFADVALREEPDAPGILPEHDAVIFDEAHKLEESATTWLGARITAGGLRRLVGDAARAAREAGAPLPSRIAERIEIAADRLLAAVAPAAGRQRVREAPAAEALVLVEALERLGDALEGRGDDPDLVAARARTAARQVAACLETSDENRVVWAEPGVLAYAPVDVSRPLRRLLWEGGPTAVLVSATLPFDFVARRIGLEDARRFDAGTPFDFESCARLYVPRQLREPREEALAEEVETLCSLSRGRALVLTTSYRMLDELAARLRGRLPYELLVQGTAPRERLLERFRAETDSVLLATATFWQGVDVQGESLSLLVIDKLPFPSPGDPLVEARCELIDRYDGESFREYALPVAVQQLRQGFGRLIRAHDDRGVVAILDPRLRFRRYGSVFLGALPPAPLVETHAEVAAFFGAGGADDRTGEHLPAESRNEPALRSLF